MPGITSIRFDTEGLTPARETDDALVWTSDSAGYVVAVFYDSETRLPVPFSDADGLREWIEPSLRHEQFGIVDFHVSNTNAGPAICHVCKRVLDPASGRGRGYVATMILPRRDFSFVLKAHFVEQGVTGMRESLAMHQLLAEHDRNAPPGSTVELSQDEAERRFRETLATLGWSMGEDADLLAPNPSEDERFDAQFPDHPLSVTRRWMRRFLETVSADPEVLESAPAAEH